MSTIAPPAAKTGRKQPIVPPQHGAWGFLALPLALGIAAAGWSAVLPLLAIAWVTAYPASWAVTGLLTARRAEHFRRAARIWIPMCLAAAVPLLVLRPWLGWVALVYLMLYQVNLAAARAKRERSLANDLVLIGECVLFVPVVAGVVAGAKGFSPPFDAMTTGDALLAAAICALTLIGSTLHVKSLIRERRNPAFATASRAFAAACPPVVALASIGLDRQWWIAAPFLLLAARAMFVDDPSWRPARIGLVELGCLIVVAATVGSAL